MNKEKILAVADAIEQHSIEELGFNMHYMCQPRNVWYKDKSGYDCRTIGCIAGWTYATEYGFEALIKATDVIIEFQAAEVLGLDDDTAKSLFFPSDDDSDTSGCGYDATPQQAAKALRYLAEMEIVDWHEAMEE